MSKIIYVNSSPATITLDFNREEVVQFKLSSAITGSKTIAIANDGDAKGLFVSISVTTSAAITLPTSFKCESTESRYVANVLTLTGTGTYTINAIYDGQYWLCKVTADGGYV